MKITKSKWCKIGCSVGASVAIMAVLYGMILYMPVIVSAIGSFGVFVSTSARIGIVALVLVIMMLVGLTLNNDLGAALFGVGLLVYIVMGMVAILDALVGAADATLRILPVGSLVAMIPSMVVILAMVVYHANIFTFCDKMNLG